MAPLGRCSARSCDPMVPLGLCSEINLTMVPFDIDKKLAAEPTGEFARGPSLSGRCELRRYEAREKVREIIAMVNAWHDSDDWKP